MSLSCCEKKNYCTVISVILSFILGVIVAFLGILGSITISTSYILAPLVVALTFLGILLLTSAIISNRFRTEIRTHAFSALLVGIIGTIVLSVVALLIGASTISIGIAILLGFLTLFFTLMLTSTVCVIIYLLRVGE